MKVIAAAAQPTSRITPEHVWWQTLPVGKQNARKWCPLCPIHLPPAWKQHIRWSPGISIIISYIKCLRLRVTVVGLNKITDRSYRMGQNELVLQGQYCQFGRGHLWHSWDLFITVRWKKDKQTVIRRNRAPLKWLCLPPTTTAQYFLCSLNQTWWNDKPLFYTAWRSW